MEVVGSASSGWTPFSTFALLQLSEIIISAINPGATITSVPKQLRQLIRTSNRICRFVLDGERTNFGTGFLVGPRCVLTAAHLFFDEDGTLLDEHRAKRVRVEFQTMYVGSIVSPGAITRVRLHECWAVDPKLDASGRRATRSDVGRLDYAVVRLASDSGDDSVGLAERRGWFEIPEANGCPVLNPTLQVRILQYAATDELQTSSGFVAGVTEQRRRVLYTASTLNASSGSAVLNERLCLAAMHLGGPQDPATGLNEGVPLRRIAAALTPAIRDEIAARK